MSRQSEYFFSQFPGAGYAIDVGANDGTYLSNTLALEKAGWHVLCIEANGYYGPALWATRKEVVIGGVGPADDEAMFHISKSENNKYAANSSLKNEYPNFSIPTTVRPLDWYLQLWNPPQLDILCVDVEGTEIDVLAGFDLARWHPKLICLEDWCEQSHKFEPYLPHYTKVAQFGYDNIFARNE